MAVAWKTPPTVNPAISAATNSFIAVVKKNINGLKVALIENSFPSNLNPYLSPATVVNVIEQIVVGPTHAAEGGWSDHPNDSGGPTMRGVILSTFRGTFDKIFISTGITEVVNEARRFKAQGGWFTGDVGSAGWEAAKQVLFKVCSDADIASLFVYQFAASSANKYPAAIMSTDPWLGFLMHQAAWASGAGYWKQYKYSESFRKFGWNGTTNAATFVRNNLVDYRTGVLIKDETPNLVGELLGQHANWITAVTKPGMRLAPFGKGWLNRLIYNPGISWTHSIIAIVSAIDSDTLTTIPAEKKYLQQKSAMYKARLNLTFPNL